MQTVFHTGHHLQQHSHVESVSRRSVEIEGEGCVGAGGRQLQVLRGAVDQESDFVVVEELFVLCGGGDTRAACWLARKKPSKILQI
jgi:hypothetical protein